MGELSKRRRELRPKPPDRPLPPGEAAALARLQAEARDAGSDLTTGGRGGLPPSTVLGILRRDNFQCKACGLRGDMAINGGLGVHHKGGVENPASAWLAAKGHRNDPNNIVTLCAQCHDRVHQEDRTA